MPLNMSLRESMQQQEWIALTADAAMDRGIPAGDIVCRKSSNIGITRNSPLPDAEPIVAERGLECKTLPQTPSVGARSPPSTTSRKGPRNRFYRLY